MSDPVQIKIDLNNGAVEVSAPLEAIDTIFARLESFVPLMVRAHGQRSAHSNQTEQNSELNSSDDSEAPSAEIERNAKGATKKKGSKGAKETYKMVEFTMDESKRERYRAFYNSKTPNGQNDQTLVVMYGLSANAGLQAVDKNEIYSGFRLIEGVSVPGKISSVLGNLVGGGFVQNVSSGKYKLTHVGEDRVKLKLPVAAKKTK